MSEREREFLRVFLPQTKMTLRHWMKRVTWLASRDCRPLFWRFVTVCFRVVGLFKVMKGDEICRVVHGHRRGQSMLGCSRSWKGTKYVGLFMVIEGTKYVGLFKVMKGDEIYRLFKVVKRDKLCRVVQGHERGQSMSGCSRSWKGTKYVGLFKVMKGDEICRVVQGHEKGRNMSGCSCSLFIKYKEG